MKLNLVEKMRTLDSEGKCHLFIAAAQATVAGITAVQLGLAHSLPEIALAAAYARLALGRRGS